MHDEVAFSYIKHALIEASLCASYPLGRFMLIISLVHKNARGCTLLLPLFDRGGK